MTKKILLACLLIFLTLLILEPINLTTSDLGRHLKNGDLTLNSHFIPETNLYSYTYPNFDFINHHWGTGVIFYLIYQLSGFTGLSVLQVFLTIITFYLFFKLDSQAANFNNFFLISILIIPLIASRVEIRPESFSYLFCGIFTLLLWQFIRSKLNWQRLLILPILELLWVNLHIYFFLGIMIISIFVLEQLVYSIMNKKIDQLIKLSLLLLLTSLATLISPRGFEQVLYPLHIFNNYGYRLLENQSIFFLDKIINYPTGIFFKLTLGIFVLSLIYRGYQVYKRQRLQRGEFSLNLLSLIFAGLALSAVRNFPLFAYFALPALSSNLELLKWVRSLKLTLGLAVCSLILLFYLSPSFWESKQNPALGLSPGAAASANFYLNNYLSSPIFNDYDIGGYLIYYLYPKERVFVDNRPEAYPANFFNDTYIPMQQNEQIWQEQDQKYHFQTIFFNRNDLTPWAQTFLKARVQDPNWAPVFIDNYAIILVRNNPQNADIIKNFKLPKEMFDIK